MTAKLLRSGARELLQVIYKRYDRRLVPRDPVSLVHRYRDPRDQEVVALIASLLAFGNVRAILGSLERVLGFLGEHPFSRITDSKKGWAGVPSGHRWVRGADLISLFSLLREVYRGYSSLEDLFLKGYSGNDPDITGSLERFVSALNNRLFFPSPANGSACKRLAMFLRWVVRPADGIDLHLWRRVSPSKLVVPLDTHLFQFARRFGLSRYRTPGWKMAQEVTTFLRGLDPVDPVKYDFAICHYGMDVGYS